MDPTSDTSFTPALALCASAASSLGQLQAALLALSGQADGGRRVADLEAEVQRLQEEVAKRDTTIRRQAGAIRLLSGEAEGVVGGEEEVQPLCGGVAAASGLGGAGAAAAAAAAGGGGGGGGGGGAALSGLKRRHQEGSGSELPSSVPASSGSPKGATAGMTSLVAGMADLRAASTEGGKRARNEHSQQQQQGSGGGTSAAPAAPFRTLKLVKWLPTYGVPGLAAPPAEAECKALDPGQVFKLGRGMFGVTCSKISREQVSLSLVESATQASFKVLGMNGTYVLRSGQAPASITKVTKEDAALTLGHGDCIVFTDTNNLRISLCLVGVP